MRASPRVCLNHCIIGAFRHLHENGLAAWDCEFNEEVLTIPWPLAGLRDNPMLSEFASHIGMKGKFFCRVCMARGKDKNRGDGVEAEVARVLEFMTVTFKYPYNGGLPLTSAIDRGAAFSPAYN